MKRLIFIGVLVIAILGSVLTASAEKGGRGKPDKSEPDKSQPDKGQPEKEVPASVYQRIEEANEAFMAAFVAHDAAAVAELYTEDAKLLPPNSNILEGRAAIQVFWQAVMNAGIATAELEILELDALGNTAVEVSLYRLYLANGTLADQGKYMVEWKRVRGHWLLHRDIFNTSQPASP